MAVIESPSLPSSHRGKAAFTPDDADGAVVWLRGEYDVATVAALSNVLARATALDDADVIVDMSGVQFMDGATIGVVVRAENVLRLRSRHLVLRAPSRFAARMLELCGLSGLVRGAVPLEHLPG